ncbi:MAG: pentapeptide repeat-containing protein [Leptolyngbya sp. SIO3F4]|nr:pentapeptide repeat-containing protein [Leptolyngbya sp. SIO3F4]
MTNSIQQHEMDIVNLDGLYPFTSEIKASAYTYGGETKVCRTLSETAGVNAIEIFEKDIKLWKKLVNYNVVSDLQVRENVITHSFQGHQLTSYSTYWLEKYATSIIKNLTKYLADSEDCGFIIPYFTAATFGVQTSLAKGDIIILDVSTIEEGATVKDALNSLCYCILEIVCNVQRESLPLELKQRHIKKYRSKLNRQAFKFLKLLLAGKFSSIRAAYDHVRYVSWERPTPIWKTAIYAAIDLRPKYKIAIASISFTVACATINHVWSNRPRPETIKAVAIDSQEAETKKLTTLALRHKIFIERSCIGCDLAGWQFLEEDLSEVDLSGANLTNARIVGSSVEGINLSEATLDNAYLEDLNLKEASISGASIKGTKFIEVYLNDTNASHVDFTEMYEVYPADSFSIRFNGVNFDYAILDNMTWEDSVDSVEHSIETTNTEYSFRYASMKGFHYEKGNLSGSDFTGADLSGAYLNKTRLTHVILDEANLSASNLRYTTLHHARAHRASFQGANLDWAFVGRASFNGSSFRNAQLSFIMGADRAEVQDVDFTNANTWFTRAW